MEAVSLVILVDLKEQGSSLDLDCRAVVPAIRVVVGVESIEAGNSGEDGKHRVDTEGLHAAGGNDEPAGSVLPGGLNGRQMADAGRASRPELQVLFITGYAENSILGNGNMKPGMAVMTKPFSMDDMAARVRSMIEAGRVRNQQMGSRR